MWSSFRLMVWAKAPGESSRFSQRSRLRYSGRLPIGKTDIIKNARPETVRGFYKKWYHPKRMAVVAVGDFDMLPGGVEGVAERIKTLFDQPAKNAWVEAPDPGFPRHVEPRLSCFADSESTNASVVVDCKRARQPVETEGDYVRTILEHLFHEALSARCVRSGPCGDAWGRVTLCLVGRLRF